jgi:hypothetical protein
MSFALRRNIGPALAKENSKDDAGNPFSGTSRSLFRGNQQKQKAKIMSRHLRQLPHEKKACQKRELRFGDLIAAVYNACGEARAKGILRLAVNARLVAFAGEYRLVISAK